MASIIHIINGKPVAFPINAPAFVGPIKPEFKVLPDMHQALLQESKELNDIARGWHSLNF